MEAAVRHLRVTSSDDTAVAPFLLTRDTVHALGHHALCCEVLRFCAVPFLFRYIKTQRTPRTAEYISVT